MVKPTNNTQQGNSNVAPLGEASQIPRDRFTLREVFPTTSIFRGQTVMDNRWAQTPFRVSMNAGDLYSRQYASGGANQVKSGVGRPHGLSLSFGGVHKGDGASGNQHYVYDSSVYTTFKKLSAKNKNYNDISFGGANNGAYVHIMGVRRGIRTM
jgi:hypothetical protein